MPLNICEDQIYLSEINPLHCPLILSCFVSWNHSTQVQKNISLLLGYKTLILYLSPHFLVSFRTDTNSCFPASARPETPPVLHQEKPFSTLSPFCIALLMLLTLLDFKFLKSLEEHFPDGANCKQTACPCRRHKRHKFYPWVRQIPWSRKWQCTPVFLLREFHGQRSLVGYSPPGHKESYMNEGT